MGDLVRKIGEVKIKEFQDNFDKILDEHREKADQGGYHGELKFKKEKGKMIIFVELD